MRIFGSLDFRCLSARSSHATRDLPAVLKLPGVCQSPFPAVSQVRWGPPFPFPAVSQGAWGPPLPFPAVPSASLGVNHFPSQFNGASRLVGLLRRGEEVHRPEAIASRVRFLRFRSPCECNLLPMGHWPPALNRVGSKGCIVPVATEWEPCPGSLTISPCGGASETHHWGAATRRFCSPCRRATSGVDPGSTGSRIYPANHSTTGDRRWW